MTALEALAAELRDDGGLLGAVVRDRPRGAPLEPGPREEVALVLEAVREGWLLHAGEPRIVAGEDPDLALLAGDRLYALGLERLAALGDLEAVAELADVISVCARSHAEGRPDLASSAWNEGRRALHREPGAEGALAGAQRTYHSPR